MTDNEIIETMKLCNSSFLDRRRRECQLYNVSHCSTALINEGIALILRQKAEIERLKSFRKEGFINLLGNCLVFSKNLKDYNDMRKGLKSEARKEFAERLMEKSFYMAGHTYDDIQVKGVTERQIDETLTELTEKGR